jgi:hypothetical protein
MTLIFALILAAGLATIITLGCVFFVVNKIQKAAVSSKTPTRMAIRLSNTLLTYKVA